MATSTPAPRVKSPQATLNKLWKALLEEYPDGVSNTSTTKYIPIRQLLADILSIPLEQVYATGAKTRTSNLDTRLVQGNQAGRHTKLGVAFMQTAATTPELEKLSNSCVVTSSKFVDGSDNTQYDAIAIFVELQDTLVLTRVIQRNAGGYYDILKRNFPEAELVLVGDRAPLPSSSVSRLARPAASGPLSIDIVESFVADSAAADFRFQSKLITRFVASLMAKRFLILTGLAGSGKTKVAQAFARWITPTRLSSDVFSAGSSIVSDRTTYYVHASDGLSVEFWNAADETQATKVTLPREVITEWANHIEKNGLPEQTPAREIREAVKGSSKFSDQLHSFETHLKAAAFAMLRNRGNDAVGGCYALVPVGADWTGNENILGYPNGLDAANYIMRPTLDLILHAKNNSGIPHFLVLDEMNLSHVERYFADILSIIESDEGLELYAGDMENPGTWRQTAATMDVPPRLGQLPENLFIIGTVNVDETTYMFSPKVLDRANVIEFRMDAGDLGAFLENALKPDLSKLDGKGASFGKAFVDSAKDPTTVPADIKAAYDAEMILFFKSLQDHGAEFGYRTAYEAGRFVYFYKLLGNNADDGTWFPGAFDCVVFQKFLPKLHGSRAKLGPVLKKLWFLCVKDAAGRGVDVFKAVEEAALSTDKTADPTVIVPPGAHYPLSAQKIGRIWRLLIENGFASFAEA